MSDIVIQAENISKLYRLGTIGTGSLRQDVQMWWQNKILKKEDHFYKKTEELENGKKNNYIWALKNVSFEIKEGESWGIIGHNGAGKSTFLKILSRIIRPTKGAIRGRGRVSSLLEVGTGFHQELSGRENIFISGYMLGMKKQEILRKFDEIVSFSGVGQFLDTPVKRYSSGMYVRLAFAVAAHLEPDILIVDEVLAVGDADFQKKCMGKMKDVSATKGRTIIFVSHNLQAITNLCNKAVWLDHGKMRNIGKASEIVNSYLANIKKDTSQQNWNLPGSAPGNDFIRMKSIKVSAQSETSAFITVRTPVEMNVELWCFIDNCTININIKLYTITGHCIFDIGSPAIKAEKAVMGLKSIVPGNLLNNSSYSFSLTIVKNHSSAICEFSNCASFDVEDVRENMQFFGTWPGIIRPQIDSALFIKEPITEKIM